MRGTLLVFQPHALPQGDRFTTAQPGRSAVGGRRRSPSRARLSQYPLRQRGDGLRRAVQRKRQAERSGNERSGEEALRRAVEAGLWRSEVMPTDSLVGSVAVLFGDREFMDAL